MLYLEIYIGCMIVMLGLMLFTKNKFDKIEKTIIIVLAPIMMIVGVISIIDQLRKNGLKGTLPRSKSKAYPLEQDDFRYWPKDTVISDDHKISLDEYNRKLNKSLTLDDVYGEGYSASLTPEEVFECKTYIPGKYGLQPNMPESCYKEVAIAFAEAFNAKDITPILNFLSDETRLVVFDKDQAEGKHKISDYFASWFERAQRDNLSVRVKVAWNPNQCRPAVYIKPGDYREMILLFYFNGNVLADIVFAPSHIQDDMCRFHDLDYPPYSLDFISNTIDNTVECKPNHLCCPTCGTASTSLNWYKFNLPLGIHGYCGDVSLCPKCMRVVELLPNMRLRYDNPQRLELNKTVSENTQQFAPRLLGLYTFETKEDCTYYGENGLQLKGDLLWDSYKMFGDIEDANNYGVYLANSGDSEKAVAVFTEASENGCQNAMLNIFTVYWANEGNYAKAVDWLKYIAGAPNPSIKCLWNLATLYYFGNNLPNNPLHKNILKAKEILGRIKDISLNGLDEDLKRVIIDAHLFYNLVDVINDYSVAGIQIHHIITKSIVKTSDLKDKGELFFRAKALKPKEGWKLGLKIADENTSDIGDESVFYIYNDKGECKGVDSGGILVQPTTMGAWQYYLLMTSPTIMPVVWHGGYICRTFIFTVDVLAKIEPIGHYDFTILDKDGQLLPKVVLALDGKSAEVYCTYWNDWKGLMREHVRITFNSDGSASYENLDEFCFYHYDCGICF